MAGNVYSTYEMAKEMAEERQGELEQDIFICPSKYKSGNEFLLKTREQVFGDYLYMLAIPFRHHYKDKQNAIREADMFVSKKGRPVYVKPKYEIQNGYKMTIYHYLTYKEPCLTSTP